MRSLSTLSLVTALVACFSLAVVSPHATAQSRKHQPEELAERADVIAVGKVSQTRSEWTPGKGGIMTKVVLSVEEYLKGSGEGSTVTLYVPGGEVDGVGEIYTHMPSFKQDEDVIVFAEKGKGNHLRVTGGSDGKILLEKQDKPGAMVASGNQTKEMVVQRIKRALKAGGGER